MITVAELIKGLEQLNPNNRIDGELKVFDYDYDDAIDYDYLKIVASMISFDTLSGKNGCEQFRKDVEK